MNPNGEILLDVYNREGNAQYKYYYSNPESIIKSMENVIIGRGLTDRKEDL